MPTTRCRLALLAVLALVAALIVPATDAGAATKPYYLSLGDSLAYGYQPDLVAAGASPSAYVSYGEYYAQQVGYTPVNLGCPGETTATMIHGGCIWTAAGQRLHRSYAPATNQLDAAKAFLAANGANTRLVTIDIGSNDLLAAVAKCQATDPSHLISCIINALPATLTALFNNYATIAGTVRALAPNAKLVLFNYYNPQAFVLAGSDVLIAYVNDQLAQFAAAVGAPVVDAFKAINYQAGSPMERYDLCAFTWMCSSYQNIHPTSLGYRMLAAALAVRLKSA